MGHQVRVDLGYFFGNQAVLDWLGAVGEGLSVAEGDRKRSRGIYSGFGNSRRGSISLRVAV